MYYPVYGMVPNRIPYCSSEREAYDIAGRVMYYPVYGMVPNMTPYC